MCVALKVKVDNSPLVAEDAAAPVAYKFPLLYGSPDVFLSSGAVQAENGDDIVCRCAAMRFHQLYNPGDEQGALALSFWSWHTHSLLTSQPAGAIRSRDSLPSRN